MINKDKIIHDPFPSNQKVLIMDGDTTELSIIANNLIPPLIKINDINELVNTVSHRLLEKGNYVTLIIGSTLPNKINDAFNNIIQLVNDLNTADDNFRNAVMVIRIGKEDEGAFDNTIATFDDVDEFIDNLDLLTVSGLSSEHIDIDKDTKALINRLETSLGKHKAKIEDLQKQKDDLERTNQRINDELSSVRTAKEVAEQKMEQARQLKEEALKKENATKEHIESLERIIENNAQEAKKLNYQNATLQTEKDSQDKIITEQNAKINMLNQEIDDLNKEKERLQLDNEDLIDQQSELQSINKYKRNNQLLQDEIKDLKHEKNELNSNIVLLKHDNKQLEERLSRFREGENDEIATGVNYHLPIIELKQTDVIYFKILREPNYFGTIIDFLFSQLVSILNTKKASSQLVILRRDEGIDDDLYPNVKIVDDLSSLIEPNQVSRLLPNKRMSRNSKVFENNNDLLFVLDYLNSKEIYVNTGGINFNAVVTHTLNEYKRSGLKGKSINVDKQTSLIDLTPIKEFKNGTKDFRNNALYAHLSTFFSDPTIANIIKKYL